MPSLIYTLTRQPVDLVAAMGLQAGSEYEGQYVGNSLLRVVGSTTGAPDINDPAKIIAPRRVFYVVVVTGEEIYVWLNSGEGYIILDKI